jgi:Ca2+-binding RTX toxin-like protein
MTTLILTGSGFQDHSGDVLSNVTDIVFTASGTLLAHFAANQFDDLHISTSVSITGDANQNIIDVTLGASPAMFSAANWTLANWGSGSILADGTIVGDFVFIEASSGNDNITGSSMSDLITGDSVGAGNDALDGGGGFDFASYQSAASGVTVSLAITTAQITGGGGTDTLVNIEGLLGSSHDDTLIGNGGANALSGQSGADTLVGGRGRDVLAGGLGADTFDYNLKSESAKGAHRDVIKDFSGVAGGELDLIDVHDIDANSHRGGNQNFHFIGAHHFHHRAGELHYKVSGDHLLVEGDVNGDGRADFQIEVHNLTNDLHGLAKGDFVL